MPDQNETWKDEDGGAQRDVPLMSPGNVDSSDVSNSTTQQQLNEVKKEMNAFEQSSIRWMRTTAGISFATAIFICLQWCEMHSSSNDTMHLVDATRSLARAASGQANSMQEFATRMKDQAAASSDQVSKLEALGAATVQQNRILSGQLKTMNRSVALSESNSKTALDASTEALHFDQRPWVDVDAVNMVDRWHWDQNSKFYGFSVAFTLKNIGKTPGQDVSISPRVVPSAWSSDMQGAQNIACDPLAPHLPGIVLFANKPVTLKIGLNLSQSDIELTTSELRVTEHPRTAQLNAAETLRIRVWLGV